MMWMMTKCLCTAMVLGIGYCIGVIKVYGNDRNTRHRKRFEECRSLLRFDERRQRISNEVFLIDFHQVQYSGADHFDGDALAQQHLFCSSRLKSTLSVPHSSICLLSNTSRQSRIGCRAYRVLAVHLQCCAALIIHSSSLIYRRPRHPSIALRLAYGAQPQTMPQCLRLRVL